MKKSNNENSAGQCGVPQHRRLSTCYVGNSGDGDGTSSDDSDDSSYEGSRKSGSRVYSSSDESVPRYVPPHRRIQSGQPVPDQLLQPPVPQSLIHINIQFRSGISSSEKKTCILSEVKRRIVNSPAVILDWSLDDNIAVNNRHNLPISVKRVYAHLQDLFVKLSGSREQKNLKWMVKKLISTALGHAEGGLLKQLKAAFLSSVDQQKSGRKEEMGRTRVETTLIGWLRKLHSALRHHPFPLLHVINRKSYYDQKTNKEHYRMKLYVEKWLTRRTKGKITSLSNKQWSKYKPDIYEAMKDGIRQNKRHRSHRTMKHVKRMASKYLLPLRSIAVEDAMPPSPDNYDVMDMAASDTDDNDGGPEPPATITIGSLNINSLKNHHEWLLDLIDTNSIDLLGLQEVRRRPFGKWFDKNNLGVHFVDRHTVNPNNSGGGVGIVWRKSTTTCTPLPEFTQRADGKQMEWCGVKLHHPESKQYTVVVCVYIPPDADLEQRSAQLFRLIQDYQSRIHCEGVVLLGDINANMWKNKEYQLPPDVRIQIVNPPTFSATNTKMGEMLWRSIDDNRLRQYSFMYNVHCAAELAPTHVWHNSYNRNSLSYSILDYIFGFGRHMGQRVSSFRVQEGQSDHSLITVKLEIPKVPLQVHVPKPLFTRLKEPNRDRREEYVEAFGEAVEDRVLRKFQRDDVNGVASLHNLNYDEVKYEDLISIINEAGKSALGASKPRSRKLAPPRPWWTAQLSNSATSLKRLRRKQYRARVDNNMQRWKQLHGEVKLARLKHQKLVRHAKASFYTEMAEKWDLSPASMHVMAHMLRSFLNARSGITNGSHHSLDTMNAAWKPVISGDVPEGAEEYIETQRQRLDQLYHIWNNTDWKHDRTCIVAVDEIKVALTHCRLKKAPGLDGITNEVLRALPDSALQILAIVFTKILREPTTEIPDTWFRSLVVLIPKVESPGPLEYRPITLLSCVAKLFERVILTRILNEIPEGERIMSISQSGFQEHRNCMEQNWRVLLMHQRAVVLKITLWMLLLDLRKAFDSVPHPLAVLAMLEKKFPSSSHRFLSAWLDGHLRRLLVGDTGDLDDRSLYHLVTKGTAQGSVTSPAVFNVSIDPLMMKLASSDPDANVVAHSPQPDTECKGEAAFADDVAVIREKIKELKQVKEICWNWANENGHEFVGKKCGVMALGLKPKKKELKSAKIPNGNDTIPLPDEYKHLGINYNRSSSLKVENAFLDYSFRLQKLKNSLNTYRRIWGSSSGTPTKVGAQMAWSITYQSLFYGAEVLPVKPKKMNQALGTVAKSVLGRYRSSSNSNAMEFLGWCNAEIYGAWCAVRFAISMLCHTLAQYRSSAGRLLMENERKQLPWAKYVWKSIKLLRLEEYFHKHLQNDGSNDMHTEEAQAELDLRKLDYKVATMRHPIVKHYAKAHHSFIFMDENSTFNPRFFKDPPKQCWVCKLPNTSDSPNHLVRECKRDVVKQILEATWIELGILRYASRNSLSHLLLSKSKPLYVNLTARQCNVLGRCHTRLYLLRKDCRDSTIALRRRL